VPSSVGWGVRLPRRRLSSVEGGGDMALSATPAADGLAAAVGRLVVLSGCRSRNPPGMARYRPGRWLAGCWLGPVSGPSGAGCPGETGTGLASGCLAIPPESPWNRVATTARHALRSGVPDFTPQRGKCVRSKLLLSVPISRKQGSRSKSKPESQSQDQTGANADARKARRLDQRVTAPANARISNKQEAG
jgi:hypothetical protein